LSFSFIKITNEAKVIPYLLVCLETVTATTVLNVVSVGMVYAVIRIAVNPSFVVAVFT
tara:strand:+ start:1136 stop:1309 length:174 start_codon:yes stop_codon:yes gene_type:complete